MFLLCLGNTIQVRSESGITIQTYSNSQFNQTSQQQCTQHEDQNGQMNTHLTVHQMTQNAMTNDHPGEYFDL